MRDRDIWDDDLNQTMGRKEPSKEVKTSQSQHSVELGCSQVVVRRDRRPLNEGE